MSSNLDSDQAYVDRLIRLQEAKWKKVLDVQRPYRWNLRRLKPGKTLEIGAGIGRNLKNLSSDSVGIEQSRSSVAYLTQLGLKAHHDQDFPSSVDAQAAAFDSILFSHVAEHMTQAQFRACLAQYLPYLKPSGKLIVICPQERGYASDATHVEFFDHEKIRSVAESIGFRSTHEFSFPFPRWMGPIFIYNEFVSVFVRG